NVLISNFSNFNLRQDKGALWENFLISKRLKNNSYQSRHLNPNFWRTHDKAEIDYIEESDGILNAFEIKWKPKKVRFPNSFLEAYPDHKTSLISRDNFEDFIMGQ